MEFTEISEINEMITYSRSMRSNNCLDNFKPNNTKVENFSSYNTNNNNHDINHPNIYDYEKMLCDSPINNSEKLSTTITTNFDTLATFHDKIYLDDIIKDIEQAVLSFTSITIIEPNKRNSMKHASNIENANQKKILEIINETNNEVEEKLDKNQIESESDDDDESSEEEIEHFEKLTEDYISKSFCKNKNTKSFLTSSLKDLPRVSRLTTLSSQGSTRLVENKSIFKVYFFKKDISLDIPITISKYVTEVIREIIDFFMENKIIDVSMMKYPKYTEAYELRMLEDDDSYEPDTSMPALEKNRIFSSFGLNQTVAFLEVPGFKPSNDADEKELESKTKLGKMKEIANQKNKLLVHVRAADANFRTTLQASPDSQIKDLFSHLIHRIKGVNAQNYQFRIYSNDPDIRFSESKNFLDLNMPLRNLQPNSGGLELEIVKKKFADDPIENIPILRNNSSLYSDPSLIMDSNSGLPTQDDNQGFLYNDVSASHYEEFEVIKINHRGKRQSRILGIDAFKLYNLSKKFKEQNIGISGLFTQVFFSKFATKHPERLLKDIRDPKIKSGNIITIEVRIDQASNRYKTLEFETKDRKDAHHIVAKLNYLKQRIIHFDCKSKHASLYKTLKQES